MSATGKVTAAFGDGKHEFFLDVDLLEELQEKTNCGPEHLYFRMTQPGFDGGWRAKDVIETLRLGLIGGGMEPVKALVLLERYASGGQLMAAKAVAIVVLATALVGPAEDEPKVAPAGEPDGASAGPSETDDGASPNYTASPANSASAASEASASGV